MKRYYNEPVSVLIKPEVQLTGRLTIPDDAKSVVLFAHGSGSSHLSPRNKQVATRLNRAGLATLLFDLLTASEAAIDNTTRSYRFDIDLLTSRVVGVIDWLNENYLTSTLDIGLFGASTGAAAALKAASQRKQSVGAIVSRGGRPDLAGEALDHVQAPTLLIVGGKDGQVIEYNQQAMIQLDAPKELEIVQGATHLFEEEGKLDIVAELASAWFSKHLETMPRSTA